LTVNQFDFCIAFYHMMQHYFKQMVITW